MVLTQDRKDKVNTMLANLWNHLVERQGIYFANKGRYWQGIRTHDVLPDGLAETPPDTTKKPTDQVEDWSGAGINLPATIPAALIVDVYNSPLGHGWQGRVEVEYQGRVYARQKGVGPEAINRTFPWTDITPGFEDE